MNKKVILLIIGVTLLAYANSLTNGFIGDDHFSFEESRFYNDLRNIPKLFTKNAVTDLSYADLASPKLESTGAVSYRPTTLFTFFLDSFIWKSNPFGFHLSNVIMHICVTLLIFYLSCIILKNTDISLFAALLFCTHPIHSELVNSISYRSDLVSLLFFLLAFIGFIKGTKSDDAGNQRFLLWSYAAFSFSLFAKESAVTFPAIILLYDLCFSKYKNLKDLFIKRKLPYFVYCFILLFYLYVYLFVFSHANHAGLFGLKSLYFVSLPVAIKIWYQYILVLLMPFKVTVLPTLYAPLASSVKLSEIIFAGLFISLCVALLKKYIRKANIIPFFIGWFFVTFIPTSNIIPVPNPMAFRFMYLPSIGYCIILAVFLNKAFVYIRKKVKFANIILILKIAIIFTYLAITFFNNMFYKSDLTIWREVIRNYPDSSRAHLLLGKSFLNHGMYNQAADHFRRYLAIDTRNPFHRRQDFYVYSLIGRCYVDDHDKAIENFKIAISLRPDYAAPYADIAKAYIFKEDYKKSLLFALKAIELNKDDVRGYVYAIHDYLELDKPIQAQELLKRALELSPDNPSVRYLEAIIKKK